MVDVDLYLSGGHGKGNDRLILILNVFIFHPDAAEVDGGGVFGGAELYGGGLGRGALHGVEVFNPGGVQGEAGGGGRGGAVIVLYDSEHVNLGSGRKSMVEKSIGLLCCFRS